MAILGIDIGGSGIKGAPVDLEQGGFAEERVRLETPQPSDVKAVVATVAEVAGQFADIEAVGVTFPGVVQGGVTRTAANVDHSWIGAPARDLFVEALGLPVVVLNDADAAGIAEMTYGAGKGRKGVTIMLTFGTGIGSAVFLDDQLVPNTELGHIQLHGKDAELHASAHAREVEDLGWKEWAKNVQDYLRELERLLNPDLMIIGGGVSKKSEKFLPHIDVRTPLVPAALLNDAGIVGAALAASHA
ncbi:polyphosphate--glucose phosphotransferase [Catellatospora tritici]|uniref:polyphosphate--glucose phosphotransferase n=1 Tax=Catellatospora tritici TaxID=2851566 RepID=UPI001C2D5F1B|nr:ROK family protein [Catellatospora tritici]MBV1856071.1 ROK family protein [Catellatospora tritici]